MKVSESVVKGLFLVQKVLHDLFLSGGFQTKPSHAILCHSSVSSPTQSTGAGLLLPRALSDTAAKPSGAVPNALLLQILQCEISVPLEHQYSSVHF